MKPVAHPYTGYIREYPPPSPPRPIGNDLRRRLANSHVTSLDYGQYAGRACLHAILNEIREPESFIHTIKLHYICSRLKKAT